jgi:hypothetical protein
MLAFFWLQRLNFSNQRSVVYTHWNALAATSLLLRGRLCHLDGKRRQQDPAELRADAPQGKHEVEIKSFAIRQRSSFGRKSSCKSALLYRYNKPQIALLKMEDGLRMTPRAAPSQPPTHSQIHPASQTAASSKRATHASS